MSVDRDPDRLTVARRDDSTAVRKGAEAGPPGGNGPAHAQARRRAVPDAKLERVDLLASSLQIVEDPAGVGEGTRVPAVEADEREDPPEELPGVC